MITKIAKRIQFDGFVQGVGFRYMAMNLARRYSIAGYVKNMPGGGVEIYAEGPSEEIDDFIDAVREEMNEYITHVEVQETNLSGEYTRFSIQY